MVWGRRRRWPNTTNASKSHCPRSTRSGVVDSTGIVRGVSRDAAYSFSPVALRPAQSADRPQNAPRHLVARPGPQGDVSGGVHAVPECVWQATLESECRAVLSTRLRSER